MQAPMDGLSFYSPPKWGCSAEIFATFATENLFPTQVGMFRDPVRTGRGAIAIPHPSGDVPKLTTFRSDD